VPHPTPDELHSRWAQRVVLGEFELCGEDTTLERGTSGALDQSFPVEHVIFGDWACGDALGRVGGEVLVFVEQALLRDGGCHGSE
jgi:hypothetical protein